MTIITKQGLKLIPFTQTLEEMDGVREVISFVDLAGVEWSQKEVYNWLTDEDKAKIDEWQKELDEEEHAPVEY